MSSCGIVTLRILSLFYLIAMRSAPVYAKPDDIAQHTGDNRVVFFAQYPEDMQKIRSSIEYSFDNYRTEFGTTMRAMDTVRNGLSIVDKDIPALKAVHDKWRNDIARFPAHYEQNEEFARMLVNAHDLRLTLALTNESTNPGFTNLSNPSSYDSMSQLLTHVGRDWTEMGREVREVLYKGAILQSLQRYLPCDLSTAPAVLVPGAGLGRLAVELAVSGYRVEANECSGAMVCAINTILNAILPNYSNSSERSSEECVVDTEGKEENASQNWSFYPRLMYQMSDEWDFKNRFVSQTLPGGSDADHIIKWLNKNRAEGHKSSLDVQLGDFSKLYSSSDKTNRFDGVVTSFFIDTAAESVLVYLSNLYNVLKDGGYWVNAGPLHYHKATNVPYSHAYLQEIISICGFELLESQTVYTDYCGEEDVTMRPEYYKIPVSIYRKQVQHDRSEILDIKRIEAMLSSLNNYYSDARVASQEAYARFGGIKQALYESSDP